MRNDVILFPSRLPSAEKDSDFHSQTLAAAPADGATWSMPMVPMSAGVSSSTVQTLEEEEGPGGGEDKPKRRCYSSGRTWGRC